jgi:hypothetical protein
MVIKRLSARSRMTEAIATLGKMFVQSPKLLEQPLGTQTDQEPSKLGLIGLLSDAVVQQLGQLLPKALGWCYPSHGVSVSFLPRCCGALFVFGLHRVPQRHPFLQEVWDITISTLAIYVDIIRLDGRVR